MSQFKEGMSRSMEELKARYYTVARDLLVCILSFG